jgi:hypothetical protein
MTRNGKVVSLFDQPRVTAADTHLPDLTKQNTVTHISPYDRRVKLVADTLMQHSELDETTAVDLAGHVLYAIDRIPEKAR